MLSALSSRCLSSVISLVLVAACSPQPDPRAPEQILTEYLRLDFAGAQLSEEGSKALSALTTRPVKHKDRPTIFLATGYTIRDFKTEGDQATAMISYRPVGSLNEMYTLEPDNKIWRDPINLTRKFGSWRVEPESAVVEVQVAIQALGQSLARNPNAIDEWKAHIRNTIDQIEACAEESRQWPDPASMSPEGLLKTYIDMDSAGGQLTDRGRDAMKPLTADRLPTEALRMIHLISTYEIISGEVSANRAVFTVLFHTIGSLEDDLIFQADRDDARVEVVLKRYRDGWEIQTPIGPFISSQAIIEKLRKEKSALEREELEQGRDRQKGISIYKKLIQEITGATHLEAD